MEKDILVKVVRKIFNTKFTISENYIKDKKEGYIVEDVVRDKIKIKGKTAIPYGTYLLGFRQSPKFSSFFYWSDKNKKLITKEKYSTLKDKEDYRVHDLLWLKEVKNEYVSFEFVLIHWGNTAEDTEGCLIVGDEKTAFGVAQSKINYLKIYPLIYSEVIKGEKYIQITK